MDKILPAGVEWIFTILLVEILVIVLSVIVDHVDPIVLYISLAIILISMVMIGFLGAKINVNTLYVSLLIHHDRYEIKKLTDCLKPSLYIYGIFGTYLWFSLNMAIEIGEIL
ncbi:hypothetical protein CVS40_10148 [Lucilia cuprina]|nr:hypothetical protein CVS40_10148 [Lucilia cuprina]